MSRTTWNVVRAAALAFCLLATSAARAEGGEHGGEHGAGHHEAHVAWWKWDDKAPPVGWLFVDFALFLGILIRFGGRAIRSSLEDSHQSVKKAIDEAAAAKADAEKKAAEYQARLGALDAEVEKLRREFKEGGESARARIIQAAEATAARIKRDTETQIGAEESRARDALKVEAARLALQLAEQAVLKQLKPEDHARLNKDFIQELGA